MRKSVVAALTAVFALSLCGVAAAQAPAPSHTLDGSVSPSKAGTKRSPKAAKLTLTVTNNAADQTTAKAVEISLDKNLKLTLAGFPTCSSSTLTDRGPARCPRGSKLGKGTAKASLFGGPITFDVTLFAASRRTINVYLDQQGGDIDLPIVGTLSNASGDFRQKLTIDIPPTVFAPAGACCAQLQEIQATFSASVKKGRKRINVLQSTGCTGGAWKLATRLLYVTPTDFPGVSPVPTAPDSSQSDTSACRK